MTLQEALDARDYLLARLETQSPPYGRERELREALAEVEAIIEQLEQEQAP